MGLAVTARRPQAAESHSDRELGVKLGIAEAIGKPGGVLDVDAKVDSVLPLIKVTKRFMFRETRMILFPDKVAMNNFNGFEHLELRGEWVNACWERVPKRSFRSREDRDLAKHMESVLLELGHNIEDHPERYSLLGDGLALRQAVAQQ